VLLAAANAGDHRWLAPLIEIAAWTAMRQGEIRRLMQTIIALPRVASNRASAWRTKSAAIKSIRCSVPTTASIISEWMGGLPRNQQADTY
jgi:replication-associated recombination protein RarA